MKALVIGTGAVGCAIAVAVAKAGMETALLVKNSTAKYIREHGLKRIGIPSEISETLEQSLWAKMLYNTTLNPLGAILNMSYGQLMGSEHLISLMNHLIEETFAVMDAAGYKTFWKSATEYEEVLYKKLIPDTFAHRSSTLQGIEKHQRTEIDTLNGCILQLGKEHKVQTPTHAMIVEMIKDIEDIRC